MASTISAMVRDDYPGTVRLGVVTDQLNMPSIIYRIDGALPQQPVRNWLNSGATGVAQVQDMEAPLGRQVFYQLVRSSDNVMLAQSNTVTVPAPLDGRSILRSVLKPSVAWMWAEPSDETGVRWRNSSTAHEVVGSDTPVVIGEVRQRRAGTLAFLCKSLAEADQMVAVLREGTPMLLRNSPCSGSTLRDTVFYALNVAEARVAKKSAWRTIVVDYQSSPFVPGFTDEPPIEDLWDFAALRDSAPDFLTLTSRFANFGSMMLGISAVPSSFAERWSA